MAEPVAIRTRGVAFVQDGKRHPKRPGYVPVVTTTDGVTHRLTGGPYAHTGKALARTAWAYIDVDGCVRVADGLFCAHFTT